ncbi:DUF465 domain-containing protein [Kistimonas scapharcae]|uniref:DUF465 domain-containing protein n=1 Tax=Kistimonas scapharcae TaxID=1036133 RepID=A0ABP8VCY8_9GAMM
MLRDKHNLVDDFPEYQERIQTLKQTDESFRNLAREYHEVEHQVRGLEMQSVPTTDEHYEALKMKRVQLKDAIFNQLSKGMT